MPNNSLPKSFAIAVAIGVGIGVLIMVGGRLLGIDVPVAVVSGVTAAVVAGSLVNLRPKK